MRRWIAERHLPSESLLIVVGNVSVNRARPMIEHYFGPIPRGKGSEQVMARMRLEVEPI
jgi:zinc protease